MDTIKIDIKPEENLISIMNNGQGIPVVEHKDEKMFVPTMIFGHLLTSSNFNDEQEKVTGGRNGYGAKLCNVFSTKFIVETADKKAKKSFKQTWASNMSKVGTVGTTGTFMIVGDVGIPRYPPVSSAPVPYLSGYGSSLRSGKLHM